MTNAQSTLIDKPTRKKYLNYSKDDMTACLLRWTTCTDEKKQLDAVLEAQFHLSGKMVPQKTFYTYFRKTVELHYESETIKTSLKEIQAAWRTYAHATPFSNAFERREAAVETQAKAVIYKIYEAKTVNQKDQRDAVHDGNCVLSPYQEDFLVQFCKILAKGGQGLNRDEVLACMNTLSPTDESHSQHALDGFLKRHPDLKVRCSSGIDPLRAAQANEHTRDTYFCKLDAFITHLNAMGKTSYKSYKDIPAKFIYNMDELASDTTKRRKGIVTDASAENSDLRQYCLTPEGDRMKFHVTAAFTTRADGKYISPSEGITEGAPSPVLIHTRSAPADPKATFDPKAVTENQVRGLVPPLPDGKFEDAKEAYEKRNDHGFLVLSTPNGSMKQVTFLPYAEHFVKSLSGQRNPSDAVILHLDGHSSRWDMEALLYLYRNNVFPFFFPSHTSIWSQPNDNGPIYRLHQIISNCATKRRKGTAAMTVTEWNTIFREAWIEFLRQERQDFRKNKSNAATYSFCKTGLKPFDPRCSSWTAGIATLGISSFEQNQRYWKSYEIRTSTTTSDWVTELEAAESEQLLKGFHESGIGENGRPKVVRAALWRGKRMLARWRAAYSEMREKLLESTQKDGPSTGSSNVLTYIENESDFDSEQSELLRKLQHLHPTDFIVDDEDNIALKLIHFALTDINSLPSPAVLSAEESRLGYITAVLDQTPVCQTVTLQRLPSKSIVHGSLNSRFTSATKTGSDRWEIPTGTDDENGHAIYIRLTTQQLAESREYVVDKDSLSQGATEEDKKRQRKSEKRRERDKERRFQNEATKVARQRRDEMMWEQYHSIASLVEKKQWTFQKFLDIERKLVEPFQCEIEVEGTAVIGIATRHEARALNFTMTKVLTDQLLGGKRANSSSFAVSAKRRKSGRYVPTITSEDGVSAIEHLSRHDHLADVEKTKKEKKTLIRTKARHDRFLLELNKLKENHSEQLMNIQECAVKSRVALVYRLFSGQSATNKSIQDMKQHLAHLRVDQETIDWKMSDLETKGAEIAAKLAFLTSEESGNLDVEQNEEVEMAVTTEAGTSTVSPSSAVAHAEEVP